MQLIKQFISFKDLQLNIYNSNKTAVFYFNSILLQKKLRRLRNKKFNIQE
jgi:hypothetical protein